MTTLGSITFASIGYLFAIILCGEHDEKIKCKLSKRNKI